MNPAPDLHWLPEPKDLAGDLDQATREHAFANFSAIAKHRLDFIQTMKVDRAVQRLGSHGLEGSGRSVKIAVLASSTVSHLFAAIRVGLLRRGVSAEIYACEYGQYRQEISDRGSRLYTFRPDVTLFIFDAMHLLAGARIGFDQDAAALFVGELTTQVAELWRTTREAFGCQVIQQMLMPVLPRLLGSNEHRLPGSPAALTDHLNAAFRTRADAAGVDLLDLSAPILRHGLSAWHDPALWHRAKQEISPAASPVYGDFVARLVAAGRGLSYKCLVLDLDNTLWGGVIGDDGLDGIRLGQGDAEGESFLAFQSYVRDLKERGVILAVCSKNDESNALAPFEKHPEMILRRSDISCFVGNWTDKAANIRQIAQALNIGLDSLVFADDNPFEREIVRRELPVVAVPEMPDDPALFASCIADAGYFELLEVTREDRERTTQYVANEQRTASLQAHTNLRDYLASLGMELRLRHFDRLGLKRITQLINKTNQFNLTTQRYTEQQVVEVVEDPHQIGLQFRLVDRFGDNGIIAIVICRMSPEREAATIDTWLMSCRVLGRNVEEATLDALIEIVSRQGVGRLVGTYRPTDKNNMVRAHYEKLGFTPLGEAEGGSTRWSLDLGAYRAKREFIDLVQDEEHESASL